MRLSWVLLWAVFGLSACRCVTTVEVSCQSDSQCPSGRTCREGRCVQGLPSPIPDDAGCAIACGGTCCSTGRRCEEGACRLDCGEGLRCGDPSAEACCAGEEICYLKGCVTPGAPCTLSSQCPAEAYCDPAIGRCLPRGPTGHCEFRPDAGFSPVLAWRSEITTDPYTEVMMSPVVIDVDGDGTGEVLANYFSKAQGYNGPGVMRALSGLDGQVVWTSTAGTDDFIHPPASIAAADLDGSGRIVAVTVANDRRLIALDAASGARLWKSRDATGAPVECAANWGGPAIADLDGDGVAEVVCGLMAFRHDGVLLWTHGLGGGWVGPLTLVADLDGDGVPDVTDGARAYRGDGAPLGWTGAGYPGFPAVGDFVTQAGALGRDGLPELVVVGGGQVALVNGQTGAQLVPPSAIPGWSGTECVVGGASPGNGGPPTVADFDGDGQPEVGVAALACYTVFKLESDATGLRWRVLWSKRVQDRSSSVTGSSVFDFEGDGRAEVVYADEVAIHVFDGETGATVFSRPHCSGTTYEYPVIVDVNGNGRADIVIPENTYAAAGLGCGQGVASGIQVLRDAKDNWVNTRRIWNQHTYHVTNVCDGRDWVCGGPGAPENQYGRVPRAEPPSWSFVNGPTGTGGPPLNSYRQNVQGEGLFSAADLIATELTADNTDCPPGPIWLRVRVSNQGALGVLAGIPVAFYEEVPPRALLGVAHTAGKLLPGESEVVTLAWTPPRGRQWPARIIAVVDDDGTGEGVSSECVEDNNTALPVLTLCGAPIN
jgi:hypothetical protein